MSWILQLFNQPSVAHSILVISLVISSGLIVGRFSMAGIKLGISGVFFSGLLFGHFQLCLNSQVLGFLREFGLILFVYAIGLQVGPSFVSAFFRDGIKLNALAAGVVILGALLSVSISQFLKIPMPVSVGIFAGASTNTPALAAAQQVLSGLPNISVDMSKMPGLGFGVSYPIGIICITLSMLLSRWFFRIDVAAEAERFAECLQQQSHIPIWKDFVIENPNLNGLTLSQIPYLTEMQVVMTRILHEHSQIVEIANHDTQLKLGDVIRCVGDQAQLLKLNILIGREAEINLEEIDQNLISKRLVVTNKSALNQTIGALCLSYGVTISRIHRPDVEFTPSQAMHVHFGDELQIVGTPGNLNAIEKALGNSLEELSHPQIMPIFIGISLGVLLGSWPIYLPDLPQAVKLGMAGGPLLVAIILSRIGNWGTMTWHLPKSSNILLRDIGIVIFLGCVGMQAGDQFLETLLHGGGIYWMLSACLVTLLPLISVAAIARKLWQINFLTLCGLLSGSMTYPPSLPFTGNFKQSAAVSIAYATVYPLTMVLRILVAQVMVLVGW